jgi:hypothetical protein
LVGLRLESERKAGLGGKCLGSLVKLGQNRIQDGLDSLELLWGDRRRHLRVPA